MPTLSRGQNAPLGGAAPYTVVVTHEPGPAVDLTGFLLRADGRVVNEDGMVFYNQPTVGGFAGVEWRPGGAGARHVAYGRLSSTRAVRRWRPSISARRTSRTRSSSARCTCTRAG
jgi:hypothetical protein